MTDQYYTGRTPTWTNVDPHQQAWPGQPAPGGGPGYPPPPSPPRPQPFHRKWWFIALVVVFIVGGIGAAIDGDDTDTESALPNPSTVTATATTADSPVDSLAPSADGVPPPPPPVESWTMPDMVGANLQDAQDAMQALTGNPLFFSTSSDLSGQGRAQVLDSNWQVCSQNVPAGTIFDTSTQIDFGVVRTEEVCP